MTDIIPAVLPDSYGELARTLERLKGAAPAVQIDIVSDIFQGEESLPLWEEFDFEFDLYVEPDGFVSRAVELGASSIVMHARHTTVKKAMEALQEHRQGDFALKLGIALRPTDEPSVLEQFAGQYDFVQIMGIDHEGRQGEPFDPRATDLVAALRRLHPGLYLQVDGHAAGHEQELAAAGANRLIVGSAIIRSDNPRVALKEAYTRANVS